ncbi:AAA family ATPase [Leptolyngbya cf. ectocarpi LEGE 11479]|uniref:histidine kinase n=1 Tax=Leptolyngbya cf. ectocarpi LEGE 11479 TaxID=1828722 RepID=A0A929FCC8_LEPEC|nr:AAA family ATPase [Leptolyngbya ectocarpi]MBE9069922.1 AAA family ATPase [Leptolyngbya cf. ectocarpi LEGE 11479]
MTNVVNPWTAANLPGYTFIEGIYQGIRTLIYRATETEAQRPVVIKILDQEYPSFRELVQFRNQYTVAKNLPIEGIVRPISLENWGNGYALVMEDFGGLDLGRYIQHYSLNLTDILNIAIQLATVLHNLHQHQVVHKDIKPANILIHPESKQIKLIDFSLASLLSKETQIVQAPQSLEGTLAYLAPEQTGRMNRGIDYRTDFYALGVTLYQLLTRQLPFTSQDPLELLHCHMSQVPVAADEVNSSVPATVAKIIAKLMAKNAENRYQSAFGLKYDLTQCLTQWQSRGEISKFVVGQRDVCDRFAIPEKLYGRNAEVQTLLNAFERVSGGSSELMLVAGFSGIGKTAVVNEVHKPITQQKGYFIKGKFDQFNRNSPFSAFVQAFRSLMGQLLGESDAAIADWKAKILLAVGESGQVLTEVIPELALIIDEQPTIPELSGTAAQNRFNLLFSQFIQVFTTPEHPLVVFLDDLQWADSASLNLLKLLLNEVEVGYLLILGAYRDNEVFPAHPLLLTLEQKNSAPLQTLRLKPLMADDIDRLVADTLLCPVELARPLSQLVYQKTKGNPFFTTQFLQGLHGDGWITFDPAAGCWQCDLTQVRQLALTDDVVEFMIERLQKLPAATQDVLKLAACIGNWFDLATLAVICKTNQEQAATNLWKSLQTGFVVPQSETYKFFQDGANQDSDRPTNVVIEYRFLHDRVQQAAYALIDQDKRQHTHLAIGELLLDDTPADRLDDRIFAIINQLNMGADLLSTSQKKLELAKLNLRAGCKAKLATAYSAAVEYCQHGIDLLDCDRWNDSSNLTLALYNTAAEAACLHSDYANMTRWIDEVLEHVPNLLDQIPAYEVKIQAEIAQNQLQEAVQTGLGVLENLGVQLPAQPATANIEQGFALTAAQMAGRQPDALLALAEMTEAEKLAALRMLAGIWGAAFAISPSLMPLIVLEMVNLSIRYGNAPISAFAYVLYGVLLCGGENFQQGYEFGEVALKLLTRFNTQTFKAKILFLIGTHITIWHESAGAALSTLERAYQAGLETGDLEFAALPAAIYSYYAYLTGQHLSDVKQNFVAYTQAVEKIKQTYYLNFLQIWHQAVTNLQEETDQPQRISGDICDSDAMLRQFEQNNVTTPMAYIYVNRLMLNYLFGHEIEAIDIIPRADEYAQMVPATLLIPIVNFYGSLAKLARYLQVSDVQQADWLEDIRKNQSKLQHWSQSAPENYQHKYNLVAAELSRVSDHKLDAIEKYDDAIAGAKANAYIQEEALANELAAKFYLSWGKEKFAAGYMQEAYYCYSRWGAGAKLADLKKRYPELLRPILQPSATGDVLNTLMTIAAPTLSNYPSTTQDSSSYLNQTLDFASILKASQALSRTIHLDELLHQLTQIILENSGGSCCALLLPNTDGEWYVRAFSIVDDTQLCNDPLVNNPNLPVKLIQYVKNTQKAVVINDSKTTLPVVDDYLKQNTSKSLLCLPFFNQGKLVGILYLKNRLISGVFTSERILILDFLAAQAAIALENARLYQDSQRALQTIQQQEARYQRIFEAVSDGLAVVDLETTQVVAANPAYCQMHGYTYTELLELTPAQVLRPHVYVKFEFFLESIQQKQEFFCNAVCTRKDGTSFNAEIHSVPFQYKGKLCGLTVFRDVTQQRQLESALKQKNQVLELTLSELQQAQLQLVQSEKMSALGNLVAGIAHEINNPISCIIGNVDATQDYMDDLLGLLDLYAQQLSAPAPDLETQLKKVDLDYVRSDLPKLTRAMRDSGNRIVNISRSLRMFSRADAEMRQLFYLHEGLESTVLILRHRLKANEQRPAIEIVKEYGDIPQISCFPGQLNQVFMNILANAIDALDEASQRVSFADLEAYPQCITVRSEFDQHQVTVTIADNGPGISEAIKPKVFDYLFTTKDAGKGTGLGLAIARQIVVDSHGGHLEVQSNPGQGTKFYIRLPL